MTLEENRSGHCITSLVFYRFRQELLELIPIPREAVRPAARLEDIIPKTMRRRVWRQLQNRGFRLPQLEVSHAVIGFSVFSVIVRSAAVVWLNNNPVFGLVILPFALVTWIFTRPLAVHPPAGCQTVREAV